MLTDRERETYTFIQDFILRQGYAPKLREIAAGLGIRSRGTVHRYLQALVEAGLIEIEPDRARGIRLTGEAPPAARGGAVLPLAGRIAAGRPIEAIPGHDEVDLSQFFVRPDRFVLRVQGDSMIGAGILDGDMVVVERRDHADDGELVVALIDDEEATLKYLRRNGDGSVTLVPDHPDMAPMRYDARRVRIQGVVVGQFRAYR